MDKTLIEVWGEKLESANYKKLTEFIFVYKLEYYISRWEKSKWSNPIKVNII